MALSDASPGIIRELALASPGFALDDYLALSALAQTPREWNSCKTSLRRACSEGGSLHDLVLAGTIRCTPKEKARAAVSSSSKNWASHAQVAPAGRDRNVRTSGSTNMLATVERLNGGISNRTQSNLTKIAELTRIGVTEKRWEQVSEMIDEIAEREALAIVEATHQEELAVKDREIAAEYKRVNTELMTIVRALSAHLNIPVGPMPVPAAGAAKTQAKE